MHSSVFTKLGEGERDKKYSDCHQSRCSIKKRIFVKEELRRTYKPKTEARVRLAGSADEKRLHILFDILSRAPKQLALLMKYVECSGILGNEVPKEVSKKELLQRAKCVAFHSERSGREKDNLRFIIMRSAG